MAEESRFQFTLRGLLGYCTLVALAMSALRLGYVELHGCFLALLAAICGFGLCGVLVGIPVGLAISGKRGARKGALIGAVIVIIGVFICCSTVVVWDGRFSLVVNLQSGPSVPISKIEYMEIATRAEGEWIAKNPQSPGCFFKTATNFDGKRFTAQVPCSGRSTMGFETSYIEYRFLVVRAWNEDGQQKCVVAEIPPGRGKRSMTLVMP